MGYNDFRLSLSGNFNVLDEKRLKVVCKTCIFSIGSFFRKRVLFLQIFVVVVIRGAVQFFDS